MVGRGARNLLLLSRHAESQTNADALLGELRAAGATVVIRNCDISNQVELDTVVESCLDSLPPIRGVIHSGMVLRVSRVCQNVKRSDNA